MTMTLIETKTLGAAAASLEFTSIPQDGTDLLIKASLRHDGSNATGIYISFNGNILNFSAIYINALSPNTPTSAPLARYIGSSTDDVTANVFSSTEIYIPNYSGSGNKSYSTENVTENNAVGAYQNLVAGLWSNTSPITSFSLATTSNNWRAGSTISLYKITKGSDGIVTTS
jgi:hypothetical protein